MSRSGHCVPRFVIARLTRNPVSAGGWIPDRVRDDNAGGREDNAGGREDNAEVRDDKAAA